MTKKTKIYLAILVLIIAASPFLCADKSIKEIPGAGDYLVLLHGLGRSSASMNRAAEFFSEKGYHVINIDYPSRNHDIATLTSQYVNPEIEKNCSDASRKIHFLTHSLGGIIVRFYLKDTMSPRIGRTVMLAPPNRGSEVADFLKKFSPARALMGPALSQLGTDKESIPLSLGPAPCEVGVIAGNFSLNWINSLIIPGPDDGKVSVKRARLEGMKDFLEVKKTHIFIMKSPAVLERAEMFLKTGSFKE